MEQYIHIKFSGVTTILNNIGLNDAAIGRMMPKLCETVKTLVEEKFPGHEIDVIHDLVLVNHSQKPVVARSIIQTDQPWVREERDRFESLIRNGIDLGILAAINRNIRKNRKVPGMIYGNAYTRNVYIDGKRLNPKPSQKVNNHSPDGFNWGYCGSGPCQLGLAILMKFMDVQEALKI